jgi:hypothetical protein
MPRHESNITRDYKEPRFRLVHVLKRPTDSCDLIRIVITAVANDRFICWWLSRILSVSVTLCIELLIDRSALLSICSADKKLWICITELTVKKKQSWGHQNAFTSYRR